MGTTKLALFALLAIFIAGERSLAIYVQYKTGYEYLYKFHTNADLNKVGDFLYSGKIGFIPIDDKENGQELLLRVYLLQMQRREGSPIENTGLDFSKWFSFVINQQGEILHVYFPNKEDEQILALKKAFAALISGKFHHIGHQSVEKFDGGKYGYQTEEIGHEGPHNATYTVEPNETGLKFTKIRHGHVMPTAESDYTKTVHYHEGLGIIHKVQVKENVEVAKTPTDFDPFEGQRPVKPVNTFTMMKWPKFSAVSEGEASFLARNKLTQKMVKPSSKLVEDSIHVADIKKAIKYAQNATQLFDYIQGNLTCLRNADAFSKGLDGIACFTNIVKMTEVLPDEALVTFCETVFEPKKVFQPKLRGNAKNMIDVLMAVDTDLAHGILLNMIFKSKIPNKELIHRLLESFAGREKPPIQEFITAIEHFVFNSETYPDGLRDDTTVHRAMLALGSISHSLMKNDRNDHAKRLVGRLESSLGMHDPYTDRQKRSTMDEWEVERHDLSQVILLDALGNAGLESSWHHILSYINSSSSIWVRKTGVHSLRKFKHEESAMKMLHSALHDESEVVRYEAGLTFQAHPKAQHHLLKDGPGPRNASRDVFERDHAGEIIPADQTVSRTKRFLPFTFNIEFHLHSPSYEWRKLLGSTKVGASFGLIIKNNLDLKLQLLEGSLRVEVHDEAYATIHLGIMGLNIDYMKIRVCFIGGAGYNLNILQDFSFDKINKMLERFERIFNTVIDSIDSGLDMISKLFTGEIDPGKSINDFSDMLGGLPGMVNGLKTFASSTMKIVGELNLKLLPSFLQPIANVALRVANLLSDIESDVMNFFNTLMESVQIALPRAIEMIYKAVIKIINSFEDFFEAPGHAILQIFGSIMSAQTGVISMIQSMSDLKEASFFQSGNRPHWWNLKPILTDIGTQLTKGLRTVSTKATGWMAPNPKVDDKSKDPVYKITAGKSTLHLEFLNFDNEGGCPREFHPQSFVVRVVSFGQYSCLFFIREQRDMKQKVVTDFVDTCLSGAQGIFSTIMGVFRPFLDGMAAVMKLMQKIKEGYEKLDNGYTVAKKVIDQVFGPKFHKRFPRSQRVAGSGCTGTGFYPSSYGKANVVEHRLLGVDLTVRLDQKIVAPRGGDIMLTPYKNEVVIKQGGLTGFSVFISNIIPNNTIKMSNDPSYVKTTVVPGQEIGKGMKPAFPHCNNHIHVAVKKLNFIVDPTKFIPKPLIELPRWVAECDDYKVVYKADVKAAGSVIGKMGQMKKNGLPGRKNTKKTSKQAGTSTKSPESAKQKSEKSDPNSVSNKLKSAETSEKTAAASEPAASTSKTSSSSTSGSTSKTASGSTSKTASGSTSKTASGSTAKTNTPPAEQCEKNQKMSNGKCTASAQAGFPSFSPGRMMKWGAFKIKNMKIGKIIAFLEKLNLPDTKEEIRKLFVAMKNLVNNRRCSNPEQMTDEELRLELIDRGLNSVGARAVMMSTYKGSAAKCPLIQLTLPKEIYCVLDPMCLGIQCCVEIGVQMFKFSVKAWARIDPCSFKLMFGIKASNFGWSKNFDLKDIFFGGDYNLPTDIQFDVLPDTEIRAIIKVQKTDSKSELSFGFTMCLKGEPDNCWEPKMLMDNAVISLPVCNADGSMTWPYVSWSDFLVRDVIRNRLLAAGKQEAKVATQQKAQDLVQELGLPEELLEPTPPCPRPDTLTNSKMDAALTERGLATSGTRSEKDDRLMLNDFSCSANGRAFSLPTLSDGELSNMYYSISDDCRRFDACFDISLLSVSVTKSFRAYIDLDTCNYEFRVGFENYEETFVTFVYTWGEPRNFTIGDMTTIFYTISKNENTQEFIVDMGVEVCKLVVDPNPPTTTAHPDGIDLGPVMLRECLAEYTILSSLAIPMQSCGSDFTLPGGNTITGFLSEMNGVLSDDAFDVILKTNQIQDILPEGVCHLPVAPDSCAWNLDQSHLSGDVLGYLNCSLTDSCFGVICCIDLPFVIPNALDMINRTVEVSFDIEPCDFMIDITVGGSWTYSTDLISYNWGEPVVLEIGTKSTDNGDTSPVQITYNIDQDDTDFYVSFDVLFCVDIDATRVCLPNSDPVRLIKRMKVPRCNPATLDTANADTTIRSWMTKMGVSDDEPLSEAGIDQFLQETHVIKNVNADQCDILRAPYDFAVDGWKNDCPLGFYDLPVLGDGIRCHIQDLCSGISCCFDVNFHGIYKRSLNMEFIVDTCNYVIRGSIERFNFTYSIFTYDWGVEDSFDLMDLFKVTYTLTKVPDKKKYQVTMKLSICLDPGQPCQVEHQLYKNTEVPQTACDMSQTIILPDGQTLKEFYDAEAPLSVEALEASLRSLGLGHIIAATTQVCPDTNLPVDEVCPDNSLVVPSGQPSGTNCLINYPCLGVECCSSLDLGIINRVFKTWLIIDPCEYRLSLGFEHFNFNTTLFTFVRGVEKRIDIGTGSPSPIALVYTIDKDATNFQFNLKLDLNIPGFVTTELPLFVDYTFPIPYCNINDSFEWPSGTLAKTAASVEGTPTEYANEAVLRATNLYWIVEGDQCEVNSSLTLEELGSRCRHLKMPKLPDFVQCRYDDMCMGLVCCLNVDYKLLKKPMKVWSVVDSCSNKVSAGLETYQYNVTLDASFWDRENLLEISDFVRAFFSVSKDDSTSMLEYILVLSVYLDDDNTYPMLDKFKMPQPQCNHDFSLGTDLSSFVGTFPADTMVGATDDVLRRMALPASLFDTSACPVADNFVQQSHANCPDFVFPTMPEGFRCQLNSDCLSIDCCATMHFFDKMEYTFKARFEILPCTYEVKVNVETDEVTRNIFENFGSVWEKSYGNALQVMYNFKKGIPGQFVVDFGLQYCMDGMCSDPLFFMHDTIMSVPLCNSGVLTWPSVDVQAAMIGYAGDAADKILALQGNLLRDSLTCDLSLAKSSCPHFQLPSLPDYYRCAYNQECTGFDCCIDMDMKVSSRTFQFRVLLDPCKLTFHVGFEKWEFNGTLKGYSWGNEVSTDIASTIHLTYTIDRPSSGKHFIVSAMLTLDADAFGLTLPNVVFNALQMPIPMCNYEDKTISWPQDVQRNAASGLILSQLGVDPQLINTGACSSFSESSIDLQARCPHFSMGSLPAGASCKFSDMCTGMTCCTELDFGVIKRKFTVWAQIDPCNFLLSVGFEKWNLNVTLIGFTQAEEKIEPIGKGLNLKYKISQSVDRRDFYISLALVVCSQEDGTCQPDLTIFTDASVPVPFCNPDGTFSWPSFDNVDANGEMVQPASAVVLNRLGSEQRALLDTECQQPTSINPAKCKGYKMPKLPKNVKCAFSDKCTGVECCSTMDLKITSRNFKVWLDIDPCDYTLSVGFERMFRNLSLIGFVFGKEKGITVGKNIKLYYMLDRTVSKGQYIISMRYEICLDSACEDIILFNNMKLGAPFCNEDGSLSWPASSYGSLLPNIIGSEVSLLKNPSCKFESLKAGTTCADYLLPTFGKQYCVMDSSCLNIACCFPSDMVVETKNLFFNFKINHCKEKIEYTFEKKKFSRSLIGFEFGVTQTEQIGTAIVLSYIVRDNGGRYQVRAEVKSCFSNNWDATESCRVNVLLAMTYYKKPVCSKRKRRSLFGQRRQRRGLIERRLNNKDQVGAKAQEQMIAAAVKTGKTDEQIANMFANDPGTTVMRKNADGTVTKVKPYPPVLTIFQRAQKALAGKGPASHQKPKMLTSKSVPASIPGAAKVIEMLGDGSDVDLATPAVKTFLFGKGLTANGLHLLGIQLANMSISDLEVFVIMARLDPIQMYELAVTMKDLFVTLYNEMIDVFSNPDKLKEFLNDELILSGQFPMPRTNVNFFKRTMYFMVGMIIPMTFSFGADGYYGAECTLGVKVLAMSAFAEVTPYTGIMVWGELGIGALLYGKLRLEGYICELRFPTYAEIWFMKFPFDVMLKMDLEIIPLKLKLIALVTLEVDLAFITIKKVLFSMNLWEYVSPTIRTNIFTVSTKDEDTSPPEFAGKDSSSGKRGAPTRSCEVAQLPGRDYTDPGFEISVRANDDRSQVEMILDIGSAPGGSDLVPGLELGGENNEFVQSIPLDGLPVYFKITAKNSAEVEVYVTCELPTYDVTLPIGRMNTDFMSTSNPRVLRASLVAMEDSPIVTQNAGIGYGKEIYGDAVLEWYPFTLRPNGAQLGSSGDSLAHFTGYKLGRVNAKVISYSGPKGSAQACASQCLTFPAIKCMSFNFDFSGDGTCECLAAIEGPSNIMSEDGLFYHYERLGIGHAVEFDYRDLWLQHNNLYYINAQLINYIEYESIISTEGILFDGTPPYPGPAPNAVEFNEWIDCHTKIPYNRNDWRHLCTDVSKEIHNHRITHDGEGATTVFNGIEPLEDLMYTRANRFISVNWDGIHDYETGIHGYTWKVGLALCEDLIHPHHDPQAHLYDESEWTHSGTIYPIPPPYEILPDDKYYATIRALNKVNYGGPMSLSLCHTTPLGIDNTPPIFYDLYNFAYDESTFNASLDYNATDPESDIMFVDACMGQTSRDCYLVPWVPLNGNTGSLWFEVIIPSGILAWPKIKVGNHVLLTTLGVGSPIIIDLTPPIPGEVFDGPHFGYDLNFTKEATMICTSWRDFADPESGISMYEVALGTAPEMEDVIERIEYNGRTSQACIDTLLVANLTLQHNTMYYFTVWAWNNAQKLLFTNVSSNGVLIDLTPPVAGVIIDGAKDGFVDLVYSSKPATVESQWRSFNDPESGLIDYELEVQVAEDMGADFHEKHAFESVFPDTAATWHHFHLHHRDIVKSLLRTTNGALNSITSETNSFIVDLTPPNMLYLNDGPTPDVDIEYSSNDNIAANWDFHDDESDVKEYDLALMEMYQGTKRPKFPGTPGDYIKKAKTVKTIEENNAGVINGAAYFTENMATNQAELSAVYKTNSFKVDKTAPVMQFVHVGVYSGFTEEVVDEHVWQARTGSIIGSWKAIDGQSGIEKYSVAVGTSAGGTDVSDYREMKNLDQGIIDGLSLTLTNRVANSPLYYLSVKAMNGAGLWSTALSSEHGLIVVDEDKIGIAVDGPDGTEANPQLSLGVDLSYTSQTTTVTVQFEGFESALHGLKRFEWAIGKSPHHEDVQPFMDAGIILRNDATTQSNIDGGGIVGTGKATATVDLETDIWYYASVRAVTYGDNVLECTTDGFVIDRTAPSINLETVGLNDDTAALGEDGVVYEMSVDSYSAEWHYTEQTSYITAASYSVGTHPDGHDISGILNITHIKPAYFDNIPNALVKPVVDGRPNVLTVHAVNVVGLASKVISATIAIDTTPPTEGTVVCPREISAVTELQCEWYGFYEAQSKIVKFRFALGSQEGYEDVYAFADVDPSMDRHMASNFLTPLEHKGIYYVTVEAVNSVGLKVWGYSESITIDNTPPKYGVIVETPGISQLDWKRGMYGDEQAFTCETEEECLAIDAVCQESLLQVAAAWTHFSDEETGVVRYEIAVGTSPGGGNIKQFFEIPIESTNYVIEDLDLNGVRQMFVTLKGYNGAGLFSITTSNGIYLTYLGQGLQPLVPVEVWDNNDPFGDKDFQADSEQLSARWDFTGDPCPIIKYFWAIYRIDNTELQPWTDTQVNTFALNDEMNMGSGQTFYVRVKGINAIGMEFHIRSDGITVQKDPLIPGRVNDGNVFGYDLLYLPDVTSVKANWDGFGVATVETARATSLSGNAGIIEEQEEENNRNQEVDYYEIAIGTDRRYPKTRDNILPFTNVGKNKTVTIFDLELIPRTALYYVTIKAHSASLAEVIVTSNGFYAGFNNGVERGEIDLQDFWQYDDYVKMQWSGFKSEVEILFYNVGISNSTDPSGYACKHLTSKAITSAELAGLFPVLYLSNVGKNQLAEVFNLTMEHTQTYYAYVIATDGTGECNMTMKDFTVDVTDPVEGAIKTGPYWDMAITYARSPLDLSFDWEGYSDADSDLREFQVALMYSPTCEIEDEANSTTLIDWITIPANFTTYKFVELDLQPSTPYYVHLRTINNADRMILTVSNPILLDNSVPTAGDVIIGKNFLSSLVWNGAEDEVSVNFLHLQSPNGPACPDQAAPLYDEDWYAIETSGLLNPPGEPWKIEYRSAEVTKDEVDNDTIIITMVQDTKQPLMYSGAYSRNADMVNGAQYQIDIKAAAGDHVATSIVFWDGPDGVLGDVNYREPKDWTGGNCECCDEDPVPVTCPCDCSSFLEDRRFMLEMQRLNQTTVEPITNMTTATEELTTPAGTSAPVPWVIVEDKKPGQVVYDAWEQQPAYTSCGMSLHSTGGKHYAVGWCRSANDTRDVLTSKSDLQFDPKEWHTYKVDFVVDHNDPSRPHWCFNVYTDEFNIVEVCGIDEMSTDTKMILHVWNANNHIPAMADAFSAFSTEARFKGVRFPPSSALECRYGTPFRGGTTAIMRYEAAIGTSAGLTDIMPFSEAVVPCVPCNNPCDRFFCNETCVSTATENIVFTISNISMPMIRNEMNATGFVTAYNKSLPYFVSLKAVLGSGQSISATSMAFYIDLTPPTIEINPMYVDVSLDDFTPVQYQASNDTIKAVWKCDDTESMIMEYEWAIGTQPNTTNLQNFTSTSWNPSGINDQLAGYIEHNTTYYVTVKCKNNARLETFIVDHIGVVAILELPNVDDVNNTIPGAEAFDHAVFPESAMQAKDPNKAGVSWTKASDPTINRYEYCLGTSNETLDDVFPCTWVGYNSSGVVEIKSGALYLDGVAIANLSSYVVPNSDTNLTAVAASGESGFAMEPGRTLFTTMRICNEAEVCIYKFVSTVTVTDDGAQLETSTSGEAITASLSSSKKRKKRSSSRSVSITTPSGMAPGQSIILGALSDADLAGNFSSGGSVDFSPFVVSPNDTTDMTARLLQDRITSMPSDSFYLAPLAHTALPDVMEVTVSYESSEISTLIMPMLIHWDPDSNAWMVSNETCSSSVSDRHVLDAANLQFTTKLCRTRTSNSTVSAASRRRRRRRRRRSVTAEEYFAEETQFVVATVLREVPNQYPNITSMSNINMNEDAGTLSYQLSAEDADGDTLVWGLDSSQAWTSTGSANLTSSGLFSYRPCLDCYGFDTIAIQVYEDRTDDVTALYTYGNVTIEVLSTKDNPEMFLAHYGYDLFPTLASYKEITIVVEQNTPENVAYSPWIGLVGAYDVDANDTLTVNILPPSHGSVLLTATTTSTPSLPQACNGNEIAEALPCDVSLAHGEASYSWKLTTLVYTPDSQYYGMDEFRVIIEDSGGKYSDILKVTVAVAENPCVSNSTCVGQTDDIDCTATKRATVGFLNEYSCACLPGWTGDTCDTDFDECSSAPCIYPYACFDKFNGYECGCPPDWLICDSGLTPLTVGLIAIIFILICVVIGFVVWYKRSKLKVVLGDLMPVGGTKAYYNIDTKQRRTLNMANKGDGYSREVPIWTTTSAKKSKALEAGILDDDVTPPCTPSTGRARRPESVDFAVRTPEPPPTVRMTTTQIDTETEEAPSPVYFNKATPAAKNVDKAESKKLLKLWKEMKARKLPSTPEPSSPTPTPTPKKTRIQSISIARLKKKPSRPESTNSTVSKTTGRESALSVSSTVSSDTMPGSMGGDI